MRGVRISALFVAFMVFTVLSFPQAALGQANIQGQWTTLPNLMPINPVHVALMRNGKLLVVSGSGNDPNNHNLQAGVWDPATGLTALQSIAWDMFCNGMVVLPDGRPFVNGGTLQYDPFYGMRKSAVFDPSTSTFTDVQDMARGRWYPTPTVLGDGRVMTFSGLGDPGDGTNNTVEFYTPGVGWSAQDVANWIPPLYPRMHLLPSGKVFYSGPTTTSQLYDPSTHVWSTVATTKYSGTRTYGTSVLLPLTPANSYKPKVMIFGGGGPSTATTEIIDLSVANPSWSFGPSMSQPRIEMNGVMLPTGKILTLGGSLNDEDLNTASLNADLYDPGTNTMSSAGANVYPRLYHSTALLLPDATVWVGGGNPVRGSFEQHIEIYKPAYLFTTDLSGNPIPATRPSISAVPTDIAYGNAFTVQTPDAAGISQVVLVRPGSPTHSFDQEQRLVGMSFTTSSGVLNVTAPPNGNIAPPGYYMLFLVDSNGVPSVAKFVHLAQLVTPDFSLGVTPNSQTVLQGAGTSYNVSAAASGGFNGTIIFSASGLPSGASASFNPTSVVGSGSSLMSVSTLASVSPGSYNLSITGTSGSTVHSIAATLVVTLPAAAMPTLSPAPGTYTTGQSVSLTDSTPGAKIYFTTDGSIPTTSSNLYSTPITVNATTTIRAIAAATGYSNSAVTTGLYTISATPPPPVVNFVQASTAPTTLQASNSTVSAAYPLTQVAGDLNVVVVGWGDTTASITSVTDSVGNTYTRAVGPTTNTGLQQSLYYAKSIVGGSNTVTVTFSQPATYPDMRIAEYSGADPLNPLDAKVAASGSGTAANSGSAATTSANELIFGSGTTGTAFTSAGTGFTSRMINIYGNIVEDRTVSATGNYSATATTSSAPWVMQMATFRAGGSSVPTVTSVSPNVGGTAGGTTVTVTGTGFQNGATVAFGGVGATNVVINGSTSITATTPAHAAGAVSVVVTNLDAKSGTLASGYTYSNAAPTVTTISPSSGTTAGGTSVTIGGTGFVSGATVTIGGVAATNVVVVGSTSITATTPSHTAGAADVVVTNSDTQSGTLSGGYTFSSPNPAPTVTGISPASGTTAGGTAVTISGTGFLSGATVSIGGTAATSVVVVGSTSITATTPAHGTGAVNVVVTNTDAQSGTLTNGFTYTNPAPTVTAISPTSGSTSGGTSVTITGTGFLSGATVSIGGSPATNVVVVSSISITAKTASHTAGAADVVVTNSDTQTGTLAAGYTYTVPNPAPTISSISPNSGSTAGGTGVTISGTGFLGGATVTIGGTSATNVVVVSSTSITASTPAHSAGAVNVVVTNTDSQAATLTNGYTYLNPAPTVTSISPSSGSTAGGTSVSISGTGFLTGASVSIGGSAATNVTVVGSTSITAKTPVHTAGVADVVVTNTDAQSGTLSGGFTFTVPNPAPSVSSISPSSGLTTGGTAITITGTGFLNGATVTLGGTAATNVTVVNSTTITASTPAHAAGAVNVIVTNSDAQSGTLTSGFTYTNPAPTVTAVSPNAGTASGGTSVTITGTGFLSGATVTFGGTAATNVVVANSTSITARTPAHVAGVVNVVVTNTDTQSGTLTNGYTYQSATSGITFVQANAVPTSNQTSASSLAAAFPASQIAGNLNVVVVGWGDNTSSISSVTDSLGNVYTLAIGPTSTTGLQQSIYYAKNIAGGSNTVTVQFNQAAAFPDLRIVEYAGADTVNPLDVKIAATGKGTTANSGFATTTVANELIFGAGLTATKFSGGGTGFVVRNIDFFGNIVEDRIVTTTGSYNATAKTSSALWVMQMLTFK